MNNKTRAGDAERSAFRRDLFALLFVAASLISAAAHAQNLTIYDDALQNGWLNYSYGAPVGSDFANPNPVHSGVASIAYTANASFNAVSFARPAQPVTIAQYPVLHFWIHGGAAGGQQLNISLGFGSPEVTEASGSLTPYVAGGIVAGQWHEATVTLNTLTPAGGWDGTFDRIDLQTAIGAQPVLYMDDFDLVPPAAAGTLQIAHDVIVSSMVSDRFTWNDSNGLPRKASISHDNVGVGGVFGVALRELQYQLTNGATRVAGVTNYGNGGNGGFGYVTCHASRVPVNGCVGDDSPLGDYTAYTSFQRIFEGRHHAIVRFTQDYPRNCSTVLPAAAYRIPLTIDWLITTGRDNPLWAITFNVDQAYKVADASIAPVGTFFDDSRAPYGELNIDGEGFTNLDGVAWGDRWRFTSTGATPVTLNRSWTWNVPNTVPYVKTWINGPIGPGNNHDAEMGIVQTQTNAQQDAGGARDPDVGSDITPYWNTTSADGNACPGFYVFPCPNDWPYQAIANSLEGDPNGTNNARMTWKTQYGFIGQATYNLNDGTGGNAPGYPKKSYSTYVVLGQRIANPTDAQRVQVETIQSVVATAAVGSVVTSGPAGITRADNVTYQPAGYNHIYGALAFSASNNNLDANVSVGAGTLRRPLLIVSNYTGSWPTVKFGGVVQTPDVQYFASLRPAANELWITLNRDLSGAVNHIEIAGVACAPQPATPVINTVSSVPIGGTGNASVTDHAGNTYSWSITGGAITGGQGTASIQFSAGPAGTAMALSVVESSAGGCPSQPGTKNVMVDFLDVPPSHPFHDFVIKIALNGITAGCGGGNYCPDAPVSRAQMAVFLLRAKHGSSYTPPPAVGIFQDAPPGSFAADWIEQFYNEGITGGCSANPPLYCPNSPVLRSQMAVFLLRAKNGNAYVPPPAVGIFQDVPPGSFAADWIEALYNAGITGGCSANPPLYCPNDSNTRGQMAVFLTRTFNLQGNNVPVTITVDAAQNRHAIDPRIYGVAFADPARFADLGVTINRWGGNATSRYNWAFSTANRCKDFYFENQPDPVAGDGSNGESADDFIGPTRAAGVDALMTIPLMSLLPKERSVLCGFRISVYGPQDGHDPDRPDCGNGVSGGQRLRPPGYDWTYTSANYPSSHQGNWITHMVTTFGSAAGGGVKYYALDNEPTLWSFDHWDIHPNGETYDEAWSKMMEYGPMIKTRDPTSLTSGVEEWGWSGYFLSGLDQENEGTPNQDADRNAHGGVYYAEWLLQQAHNYEQVNGTRILDVFALHFYPQSGEFSADVTDAMQTLRNRSTRALWDTNFVDLSWIGQSRFEGGIVRLIPRLKQWVTNDYPGTKIGITEYNWGAENHINGATAQADILGIFGREALDLGVRWTAPPTDSLTYNAFKMYRNYDGAQSRFGDLSVSASGPNPDNVASFAALRSVDNKLTLMVIAKTKGIVYDVTVNLASFNPTAPSAQRYQLTSTNTITNLPSVAVAGGSLSLTVPAQSITLLVLPGTWN